MWVCHIIFLPTSSQGELQRQLFQKFIVAALISKLHSTRTLWQALAARQVHRLREGFPQCQTGTSQAPQVYAAGHEKNARHPESSSEFHWFHVSRRKHLLCRFGGWSSWACHLQPSPQSQKTAHPLNPPQFLQLIRPLMTDSPMELACVCLIATRFGFLQKPWKRQQISMSQMNQHVIWFLRKQH